LRIQKNDPFQVGQEFLDRFVQESGHVVKVHAAVFIQGDEQCFFGRIDRLDGLPTLNLKNALTTARLSPGRLFATQIVALCSRATKRPKWTVCGAVSEACFLLAAK